MRGSVKLAWIAISTILVVALVTGRAVHHLRTENVELRKQVAELENREPAMVHYIGPGQLEYWVMLESAEQALTYCEVMCARDISGSWEVLEFADTTLFQVGETGLRLKYLIPTDIDDHDCVGVGGNTQY